MSFKECASDINSTTMMYPAHLVTIDVVYRSLRTSLPKSLGLLRGAHITALVEVGLAFIEPATDIATAPAQSAGALLTIALDLSGVGMAGYDVLGTEVGHHPALARRLAGRALHGEAAPLFQLSGGLSGVELISAPAGGLTGHGPTGTKTGHPRSCGSAPWSTA